MEDRIKRLPPFGDWTAQNGKLEDWGSGPSLRNALSNFPALPYRAQCLGFRIYPKLNNLAHLLKGHLVLQMVAGTVTAIHDTDLEVQRNPLYPSKNLL